MTGKCGFLLLLASLHFSCPAYAQYDSPVSYMGFFNDQEEKLAKDYMGYMSAIAHGNNARRMERRRAEVLSTVKEGRQKVASLKAYHGETMLRNAYAEYFSILQSVLNEDYAKIVNMEEIAEQSYDDMEAYLLAQEKASERLRIAADTLHKAYRQFAEKYEVRLTESESSVSKKLRRTGKVMNYYNQVYLIYFKSSKQEGYVVSAANAGNINSVEQNKSTLIKYSNEGTQKLDTLKPFEDDHSLTIACRKLLEFYKMEAEEKISALTNYFIKKDEFNKYKKVYEARSSQARTAQEVEDYNTFVAEINKMGTAFNQTNDELNAQRRKLTENWSSAVRKFLDSHIPSGK